MGATTVRPSGRLTRGQVFLLVTVADVLCCQILAVLSLAPAIWLLNLPATVTVGRVAALLGGEAAGLAVTVPVGAAIYGWVWAYLRGAHSAPGRSSPA